MQQSVSKDKPLVTMAVFTYNQEEFIADAVKGALAQTYQPLEIVFSDDCSKDRTFEILSSLLEGYSGPHAIVINRTKENAGLADHINQVGRLASGDFVVLAAGDDISKPTRVAETVSHWNALGQLPICIYSDFDVIGPEGAVVKRAPCHRDLSEKTIDDYAREPFALMASYGFSRSILDSFEPMQPNVINEDFVLAFRSLLLAGRVHFIPTPLISYRVGVGISSVSHRGEKLRERFLQQNIRDLDYVDGSPEIKNKLNQHVRHAELLTKLELSGGLLGAVQYLFKCVAMRVPLRSALRSAMDVACPNLLSQLRRLRSLKPN